MAKRALLVGCNYPGTEYPLNGCVNDALAWIPILRDIYGFQEEDIEIMIDTDDTYTRPTGKNIKEALRKYVAMSEAGDVLFFQFSGHGVQVPDDDAVEEADRQDEAICPTDMNLIIDDDMREIVNPLNPGCKFTFVADCCHSGGILDHEKIIIQGVAGKGADAEEEDSRSRALTTLAKAYGGAEGEVEGTDAAEKKAASTGLFDLDDEEEGSEVANRGIATGLLISTLKAYLAEMAYEVAELAIRGLIHKVFGVDANNVAASVQKREFDAGNLGPGVKPREDLRIDPNKGILLSASQSAEKSADVKQGDKAYGAFSHSLQEVLRWFRKEYPKQHITNRHAILVTREVMKPRFTQNACLECSEANADSPFIIHAEPTVEVSPA